MLSIGETTSNSLRRLQVLNRILNATSSLPPMGVKRTYTTISDKNDNEPGAKVDDQKTFVRIGNSVRELKPVKAPEKVPRGYLQMYNGVMSDSQTYLKYLRWLMQKDGLRQDAFLIGAPPGAFRRHLALSFAELLQREVEYLCLTRDTTESDIKQRREIISSSVIYANQCAVEAALNGRILIIEGIEKAERNLLPILNNLLENREMNLDDGHFLVSSERYDKLTKAFGSFEAANYNLLRVHEDFRVIAIGLPVPKYKGNLLDPPLRSRFQAHLVPLPAYDDYLKYLKSANPNVPSGTIENLLNFAYSFYQPEMESLNLPDFPVENLDKLIKILDKLNAENLTHSLNLTKLVDKLYPYRMLLRDEETNKKFYSNLLEKFGLPCESVDARLPNEIDYKLDSVQSNGDLFKRVKFTCTHSNRQFTVDVGKGEKENGKQQTDGFIMNDYHSSQLVDMMLNHASGGDFCLIGNQGSGKSELIKKFASLLDYNVRTVYLYKDMSARDLVQTRITLTNGDTKWHNSQLVEAAINGDLAVLDGIHRLKDDTLMSLRRLIQDRELDLPDGTKLLRHDKYDSLMKELDKSASKHPPGYKSQLKIHRISPSFRIIATAEPPNPKTSATQSEKPPTTDAKAPAATQKVATAEWLNSEVLNLFLYQHVEPLELNYEQEILGKMFKLNEKHRHLLDVLEKLKKSGETEVQLKHIAKLFSLRKVIRLARKLERHPQLDLVELIENESLFKFMPQLNKELLVDFFAKNKLKRNVQVDMVELKRNLSTIERESASQGELKTLAKIPDTLFYENDMHTILLNNLVRDFDLKEHLLLIGNQGTGKNKLVDKFLMLTNRPREYVQLHRDTTVHSLTIQPVIKSGVVYYEDSPLVKAVKDGHVLVIDEADKAPLHVTCILKSLIESGEMQLSDGRYIVPTNYSVPATASDKYIRMHANFRMIILANRFSFPFLGNDFFTILGDLLSCHPIDNPDPQSEIEMLRMYAPNVSQKTLNKLVGAFNSLRQLSDQGLIAYPYSTRELVNIVRHLEKYPDESLASVLANVYDFDHFAEQNELKMTFKEVMRKHGIPIDVSTFQINLAQSTKLPAAVPMRDIKMSRISPSTAPGYSMSRLNWTNTGQPVSANRYRSTQNESRLDSFSELRSSWSLNNNQQIITDMVVVAANGSSSNSDRIFISGNRPLSVAQLDTNSGEVIELALNDFYPNAWRTFFPRLKLLPDCAHTDSVLVFEETSNLLYRADFATNTIHKLESQPIVGKGLIKTAKNALNRYFADQNQIYKMSKLSNGPLYLLYRLNSNEITLLNLNNNRELTLNLGELDASLKLKINFVTQLDGECLLLAGYDATQVPNSENLSPKELVYYVVRLAGLSDWNQLTESATLTGDDLNKFVEFHRIADDAGILGDAGDLIVSQLEVRPSGVNEPWMLPSIYNHYVNLSREGNVIRPSFVRREKPLKEANEFSNWRSLVPNVRSIVDLAGRQIITQIPKSSRFSNENYGSLGFVELVDLDDHVLRRLEVPSRVAGPGGDKTSEPWRSFSHFNYANEANFLLALSPTKRGNFYTLDLNGNLSEWETAKMNLERSLDDWQKLVMDRQSRELKVDVFKQSPNTELKDFKGPKHGKVDKTNAPHVGGNTWAGGSGGFDTAGLGGVGGPYRLSSGNQVFQISDELKQSVPESVRKAAREMAEKAFRERLREINMSEFEHEMYTSYLNNVKKPIQQLRNILDGLEAKKKERQWLRNQIEGDLDDQKLVEAITGEKAVYRRRGDDPNADNSHNMEKPKRLKLVVDLSGSMYRFNGVDNRLEREIESVLMVMEAFKGYEDKILYDIVGHSGDGHDIKVVDATTPPKNEAERLKILKTMIAHSQFCSSGDFTFKATKHAIQEVGKEDADDHFVIVLSDANFDRYGLSPKNYARIMLETDPKVNVYCIFIGTLGDQANHLKKSLPFNKAFVCMNTQDIPKIMQQIFQSAMLN